MAFGKNGRPYTAPALEKGLAVLEVLANARSPMRMAELSAALNRNTSELFRIIQVLKQKGYVKQARKGEGFELSDRVLTIGAQAIEQSENQA